MFHGVKLRDQIIHSILVQRSATATLFTFLHCVYERLVGGLIEFQLFQSSPWPSTGNFGAFVFDEVLKVFNSCVVIMSDGMLLKVVAESSLRLLNHSVFQLELFDDCLQSADLHLLGRSFVHILVESTLDVWISGLFGPFNILDYDMLMLSPMVSTYLAVLMSTESCTWRNLLRAYHIWGNIC